MKDFIEFPLLPITKETFQRQGWEEYTETEGYDDEGNSIKYTYYILPLPKDCFLFLSFGGNNVDILNLSINYILFLENIMIMYSTKNKIYLNFNFCVFI